MPLALLVSALLAMQSGGTDDPGARREAAHPAGRPLAGAGYPVLLEQLGDDGIQGNAEAACRELLARGAAARPHLHAALQDEDPQRRFLAAWTLAFVGPEDDQLERVCRTLIPALGDDDVPGNGLMAGEALRALDRRAIPWLQAGLRYETGQVHEALLYLTGGGYPYRRTTAWGQAVPARFLLGPNRKEDWGAARLSAEVDSPAERVSYLVRSLGDGPPWMNPYWIIREIREWHADHARADLEAALDHPDRRVRHQVAGLLRGLYGDATPSARLLLVCVEALQEDDIPGNAGHAMRFLVKHYALARDEVGYAVRWGDRVVRYRAAMVAAHGGETDLERWVPALIEALADDDIVANGMGASRTLASQPRTRPWVEGIPLEGDAQQRALAKRILGAQDRVLAGERLPFGWRVNFFIGATRSPED